MEQEFNFAHAIAQLALQMEKEVITALQTRIAFNSSLVTKEEQPTQTKYTYTISYDQSDDAPVSMNVQISFAKFTVDDGDVGYVENVILCVGDAVFATFSHVSTPETFKAVEENYKFYLKAKDNPELLEKKPKLFVPEKKIVIA